MKAQDITDEKLLDYIDKSLSAEETEQVKLLLERNDEIYQRWKELSQVNTLLTHKALRRPSVNFTASVMQSIAEARPGYKKGGIMILLVTLITIIGGSVYMVEGMINLEVINQLPDYLNARRYAPDVISLKTLNLGLLFTLSILSLLLLDKVVLRPLLKS